jgi:hypothetical protein
MGTHAQDPSGESDVMAANQPNPKQQQLDGYRIKRATGFLTTQQGVRVDHADDTLTAGERGPTLLDDFHAREKITHFDHERIPERVVHSRGAGATEPRAPTTSNQYWSLLWQKSYDRLHRRRSGLGLRRNGNPSVCDTERPDSSKALRRVQKPVEQSAGIDEKTQ